VKAGKDTNVKSAGRAFDVLEFVAKADTAPSFPVLVSGGWPSFGNAAGGRARWDKSFPPASADRIVVLDFGKKVAQGVPYEIRNNPIVQEAYLGAVM
jgi:Branched-chain amino acid ATP-binding cassette transporter